MKAVVLAGGRGSRLNKLTENKSKSMLKIYEKPLIEYNLDHAISLGVNEIIVVVGYRKNEIMKHLGKEYRGTKISYVIQKEQRGVVNAIECARKKIGEDDFVMVMADEVVPQAKMQEMYKKFRNEELFAICGVVFENDKTSIGKTYSAMISEKGRVFRLIEKPRFPINPIKGTGHCIMKNEMLDYIERTPINAHRGEKELVDMIQCAIDEGKKVNIFELGKGYVNVNTQDDLDLAKNMLKKDLPRVLIVHTQMKFLGGAELLIVELANWLTKKGIKNDILALSKSKEVQDRLINTEIIIPKHHINLEPPGFKNPKEIIDFIKIYRKEIKNIANNYDVINFHNFPVTWTLFPRKKPCVWMLNEPPNLWSKPNAGWKLKFMNKIRNYLDKIIINNSVDIICVADEFNHKRTLERYGRNSKIVFYGVNYDFFSKGKPNKAIQKWSLKNKFVIVQSGVLNEPKNQLESIKILNKIKNEIPNVLLVLAGKWDEDYKKKLDEYVKQNNIEKYVLFTGNLGREELRDLYSACHMGLFPVGEQGGWLAPFELLCSGKPLVVSKEIGVGSIIRKFNLGLSTNEYDKAVLDIYKNYNNYSKSSKEIKEFIKNNFGWNIFTDKLIRAFKGAWKSHTQDITYIH